MPERPTFELGLVMAGAISAGAYTAGVLDFLLEALDAIEDVRAGRDTSHLHDGLAAENPVFDPPHRLRLKAMSGTSAGAMVTAILTTVLGTRIPPVGTDRQLDDDAPTDNPLYDAWVLQIHQDKLLSTDDVAGGAPVCSLLNARHLEGIVAGALRFSDRDDYARSYVGSKFPVYLCVGNLRGVRYSLGLSVGQGVVNEHQMSMHADWLGFCFDRDPEACLPGMLSLAPGQASDHWDTLGTAALASGAFPIGLAARAITRDFTDYERREWYDPVSGGSRELPPLDHASDFPNRYSFVNVDGGIFNNEPLELCRVAVAEGRGRNPRDPKDADRAVLMIDPFPNLFELDRDYDPVTQGQLLQVLKSLSGAFVSQSRFKPDELALAKDPQVASRFAIMPIRYGRDDRPETYAIACGSLGGFGGFLSKAFRHHDFMLGRRNCQRFLSHHFVLPADSQHAVNPLLAAWTDPQTREPFEVRAPLVVNGAEQRDVVHLPIVPLLGKLGSPDYTTMPSWPADPSDLAADKLKEAILQRADAVKDSLVTQYRPDTLFQAGIWGLWKWNRKKWVQRFAMDVVEADLVNRGLVGREWNKPRA